MQPTLVGWRQERGGDFPNGVLPRPMGLSPGRAEGCLNSVTLVLWDMSTWLQGFQLYLQLWDLPSLKGKGTEMCFEILVHYAIPHQQPPLLGTNG